MAHVAVAVAIVAGLCGVLAALLVVAERLLLDYGTCSIEINRGSKRLAVRGGGSLLASLMEQGIFIPSACGGRGTCGYCKVRVLEGGGPVVPTEEGFLSEEERASRVRVSCQVRVRDDLAIEIPEELFRVRQFAGRLEEMRELTRDIRLLRIALLEPPSIEFIPGQYVQLETPPYGPNREAVYRAYSIASPPGDTGHIELIIRLVPGGICTTWVFTVLKEGETVRFNGPYGDFRLAEGDSEMVWIAGGSGMAPFWSMARHMRQKGLSRKCTYFFGAVQRRDLFFLEEFRELEKELADFRFIPALSAPAPDDHWDGETGLITEVVERHLQNASHVEAYLCGSSGMIDASLKVLRAKGMPEERIFYDKFT